MGCCFGFFEFCFIKLVERQNFKSFSEFIILDFFNNYEINFFGFEVNVKSSKFKNQIYILIPKPKDSIHQKISNDRQSFFVFFPLDFAFSLF